MKTDDPKELLKALETAVREKNVEFAESLTSSNDKAVAKAAKKALYQLKSAGVAVPEKKPEVAAPPEPAKEDELFALSSPLMGNGERLLLIPRPVRGGLEMVQISFTDELGVVELTIGELNRSQYRKQLKLMREGRGAQGIDLPRAEGIRLFGHALWLNSQSGTPAPKDAEPALRHLGGEPAPAYVEIPAPEEGDATLAVEGGTLHDEGEIQAWLPPEEELRSLGLKMDEIAASPLYVDDAQRAEQMGRTFVAAAEAFFTPERKKLYARRLWEMAKYFDLTQRQRKAQIARAEARRLFHDSPGLFSPFAQRLFEKVLMFTQTVKQRGAMPAPSARLGEEAAPSGEKKSSGGIILP